MFCKGKVGSGISGTPHTDDCCHLNALIFPLFFSCKVRRATKADRGLSGKADGSQTQGPCRDLAPGAPMWLLGVTAVLTARIRAVELSFPAQLRGVGAGSLGISSQARTHTASEFALALDPLSQGSPKCGPRDRTCPASYPKR